MNSTRTHTRPSCAACPATFRVARLDALCRQPADVHLRGQRGRDGAAAEPLIQQLHRPVRSVLVRGVRQVLDLACLQQLVVPADHGFPGGVDHRLPDPQRAQDAARRALVPRARPRQQPARVPAPRRKPGTHRRAEHGDGPEDAPGTFRLRGARAPGRRRRAAGGQEGQRQPPGVCVRSRGHGHHLHRRAARQRIAGAAAGHVRWQSPSSRTC